jgi:hypothetical protein
MPLGKLIASAMITVGLFGGSSVGHAQIPELLIPVDGAERDRVVESNEYFIKRGAYFARRYRVVRVNTELLLGDQPQVNASLFDDLSIFLTRDKFSAPNDGQSFVWQGHYTAAPVTSDEFGRLNPNVLASKANIVYKHLFNVEIRGTQYVFDQDPADAEAVAGMRHDRTSGRIIYETERLAEKLARGTVVYSVRADLNLSAILEYSPTYRGQEVSEVQIRPLPMDRRYSVVYELDPDKMIYLDEPGTPKSPEQREKQRQYREFLDSLGPDPRMWGFCSLR